MQRKILIVDDNSINLVLLRGILSDEYDVIAARNGREALRVLSSAHDSLSAILLDLSMPEMNGFEVLDHMHADPELTPIPVIVMTGSTDIDSEKKALALGAHDYITKPYDPDIIKHRLSNIIKLRESAAMVNELRRDRLTGLLTRENFFEQASALIKSHESGYYVMTSFDINRFKVINDQYGSETGDKILRLVARVFSSGFERIGGMVGRIMADHFAVLYPVRYIETKVLSDIREAASVLDGSISPISFSIGRYIITDLSVSVSSMYDRATLAEQSVKGRFDNNIGTYDETMRENILQEQTVVSEMKKALSGGQFEVWFQPQYNHATGALIGGEALVRWRHPVKGLISPAVFIPIFERNGFIYEMDKFVWESVCIFLRRLIDSGGTVLPVSVNVSRYDILQGDLVASIVNLTENYAIPHSLMRLEITESAFAKSTEKIIKTVNELIALGFIIEIDDFGSGYSSLNTLKDVYAHIVKLDMRFFEGDDVSGRGGNIIESVVRMIKWLNMSVIAEGVETTEQANYLRSIGCIYVQGYLYARPMPETEFSALMCAGGREEKISSMNSLKYLDNNVFWSPDSIDTLIFNSFAGNACIMEFCNGKIEMLKINEHYLDMLGSSLSADDALKLDWAAHLSNRGICQFRDAVIKSAETKNAVTGEYILLDIPGCPKTTYLRANMRVIASSGERYLIYCINDNITAQRLSERAVELANAQLRGIMDDMPGGFVRMRVDEDGGSELLYFNDGFKRLVGMSDEQIEKLIAVNPFSGVHPDNVDALKAVVNRMLNDGKAQSMRYRLLCGDGTYIWLSVFMRISSNGSGTKILNIYYTDASEQVESERLQNTLLDNLPGGAGIYELSNGQMQLVYQNKSYWELVGLNEAAFPDSAPMSAIHPDDIPAIMSALSYAIEHDRDISCDIRLRHLTRGFLNVHLAGRVLKTDSDSYRIYATFTPNDIQSVSTREMLSTLMSAIMESTTDLAFIKDVNFRFLMASRAYARLVGKESGRELVGLTDYDLFDKEIADKFRQDDEEMLGSGKAIVDVIERIPFLNGESRFASSSKYLLRDGFGSVIGLYCTGHDITQSIIQDARLNLVNDNIPGGIATYTFANDSIHIIYCNEGFCALFGGTVKSLKSRGDFNPLDWVFENDRAALMAQVRELIYKNHPLDAVYRIHVTGGGYKWINQKASTVEIIDGKTQFSAVMLDITDLRRAERRLDIALANTGVSIWDYDFDRRCIIQYQNSAEMHGFEQIVPNVPDSLIECGFVHPDSADAFLDMYDKLRKGAPFAEGVFKVQTQDRSGYWFEHIRYTNEFDKDGKPFKAVGMSTDETQKQEALEKYRQELEKGQALMAAENLLAHASFDLTTGKTLECCFQDGSIAPHEFTLGRTNASLLIDEYERALYLELNDTEKLIRRFIDGESEFSLEYRRRMPDDSVKWVRNLYRLLRDPDNEHVLAYVYWFNIDDEKTLELTYKSIIAGNYDFIARIDVRKKRFYTINYDGISFHIPPEVGDDADKIVYALADDCILPEDKELFINNSLVSSITRHLAESDRFTFTYRMAHTDGTVRYKKITQYYIDPLREIITVTREDITALIRTEMEKNRLLSDALTAANQASLAKSTFLSRMSHELRTPMNAIIGLSALSATEIDDRKRIEDNLNKIGISARYLLSIINDILEMSRIESGRLTLNDSPFDFGDFIVGVNAIINAQAETRGVDYDVIVRNYIEPTYIGDSAKLQEILVKVLGNAIKFTPSGGKVMLSIEQVWCVNGRVCMRFTVSDTGVGIDDNFLPYLFEPFSQEAASFVSTSAGTGLGLAIAKNLAELMSGKIRVKSTKNVGSVFTIDVQLSVSSESLRYLDMLSSLDLSHKRALVVDDDVDSCESAEKILSAIGMQVESVYSGQSAVERASAAKQQNWNFDAIFVDWKMPDMDGIEATRRMRKIVGRDVAIFLVTAFDWRSIETEARDAGVDVFLDKPLFQPSVVKAFNKIFAAESNNNEAVQRSLPDFDGKRILLAEDNPMNVEVLRRILELVKAEVVVANNGLEALETFATKPDGFFDAILMDVRMPEMDGLTATKNIRKLKKESGKTVPIIAVTANAFDEDVQLSLSSGMNAHLTKPIDPPALFSMLKRLMKPN